ncbi:MAG: hypothetical protein IJU28_03955, partial [Clostridia bacterium]|nr:hypothetical protein [Clostridia bacterium]
IAKVVQSQLGQKVEKTPNFRRNQVFFWCAVQDSKRISRFSPCFAVSHTRSNNPKPSRLCYIVMRHPSRHFTKTTTKQ